MGLKNNIKHANVISHVRRFYEITHTFLVFAKHSLYLLVLPKLMAGSGIIVGTLHELFCFNYLSCNFTAEFCKTSSEAHLDGLFTTLLSIVSSDSSESTPRTRFFKLKCVLTKSYLGFCKHKRDCGHLSPCNILIGTISTFSRVLILIATN